MVIGYNYFMDNIKFISTIKGLERVEECLPRPAKHFVPKWFKDIPSNTEDMTVKICPSFPDFFSQGYILPMWTDTVLKFDVENKIYDWGTSLKGDDIGFEVHGNQQFIDYVDPYLQGSKGKFVFKALCPWSVITPPGWSVLQLPLFYHFNQQWSVMPGVIDTDIYHTMHQQILYHGNGEVVKIGFGEPLALYIPFKRDSSLDLEIRYQNEDDEKRFNASHIKISSVFRPNGMYRRLQRLRDKRG